MKKIYTTKLNKVAVRKHRTFRRFVRKMFGDFTKRQCCTSFEKEAIQRLQEIEDTIEIIARQMARWLKAGD